MTEPPVLSDYFRINFEDEGRRLSLNALVSSADSMTRLIALLQVCRKYMAAEEWTEQELKEAKKEAAELAEYFNQPEMNP